MNDTEEKEPELDSVIIIDDIEQPEDVLAFLDKDIMGMTDDELQLYEMLENGVLTEDELRQMLTQDGDYSIVEEMYDDGFDDFFDDYFEEDNIEEKYPTTEKDQIDFDDDDYDFENWFKGQ